MPTRVAAQELLRVLYGTRYVAPLGRRYGNAILEIINYAILAFNLNKILFQSE